MKKAQREIFIEEIYHKMKYDNNIFFLTADLGSIQLDNIRKNFKDRYINVGIAEQNLVNIGFGLALEGFIVYCYGISAFLTMRAFEQIRNLAINIQNRKDININLLGVGTGLSYDLSGPSHSCLEDLSIMRTLPNLEIISPSDWAIVQRFVDYSLRKNGLKYLRFDGKPVEQIYDINQDINLENGFFELKKGDKVCLISTGIMTHKCLNIVNKIDNIGLIDVFLIKGLNEKLLFDKLKDYKEIITISEEFVNKSGLDSLISSILSKNESNIKLTRMGFEDKYEFRVGHRDYILKLNRLDIDDIIKEVIDNGKKYRHDNEKYNLC